MLVPGQIVAVSGSTTATTISLSWSVPSGSVVDTIVLGWQRNTAVGCPDTNQGITTLTDSSANHVITGLEEDSSYSITVRAVNAAGSSQDIITAMTVEASEIYSKSAALCSAYSFSPVITC